MVDALKYVAQILFWSLVDLGLAAFWVVLIGKLISELFKD